MNPASAPRWPRRIILLAFTLSGVSGLIYELVWMRRLTLIFGSTTLAVSTVLAALMGGLALGSYLLGRVADRRSETALFTYGLLEVGLTLYALLMPLLFRLVEALYLVAYPGLESAPSIFFFLQFLLTAAVIVPPSVLMGGTLPMLGRALVSRLDDLGGSVGTLYAVNTLGAGAGTALATYLFLPQIGLWRSQLLAAMLSLAAGGVALVLDGYLRLRRAPVRAEGRAEKPRPPAAPAGVNVLLLGTALSGFAAMVYEVVWTRVLGLVLGSSVYAFGMMLLLFLAGLAAGSALFSRLRLTAGQSALAFAAAEAGIAAAGVAAVALIPRLPFLFMRAFPLIQHSFFQQQLAGLILAGLTLFPAAVCFGLAFPAVVAATTDSLRTVGRGVGSVAALNMIGTVGGAFLTGFVLIPQLGLRAALLLGVGAVLVAGGAALWTAAPRPRRARWAYAALTAGLVILPLILPPWSREVLASGTGFYAPLYKTVDEWLAAAGRSEFLFYKDGISATITVDRQGDVRFYRFNGKTDASTHPGDMANQLLLGHLPLLLHPAPQDVFILGLGTGVTAAAVARYPVRQIDIVDIEPAAREAARFFEPENRRVLADARVRLLVADGRNALLARPRTYDVIISDPSDVWVAGVGTLFTREFYEVARSRLRAGGVMVQWFHAHSLPPAQLKLIVATFRSVFPQTSVWRPNRGDVILLGTLAPVPWDYERLRERIAGIPGVEEDLRGIGLWHPVAPFAAFVLDGEDVARMVTRIRETHADDRPVLEFLTPRALYADTTPANDAGIQRLQRRRLPVIAGFVPERDMDARATYLLGFGYASLGRTDQAIASMEESTRRDPQNPRYLVGLGHQYRAKGLTGKAIVVYRRALRLAPGETEAAVELAALLRDAGETTQAEEVLRQALQAAPDSVDLLRAAGTLLIDAARSAEAAPLLRRAASRAPKDAGLHLLLGQALRAAGRRAESIATLRRAAALSPQDGLVQRVLGETLLAAGVFDDAMEAFRRAVTLDPRDVDGWVGLARAARRRGDAATARRARDQAMRLDPYNPSVIDLLGE